MDKLINNKKGITLIELIIYMGIFSFIFITTISSLSYIQKIIQNNNQNYYTKKQIYFNLNILQQYLLTSYVRIENNELKFFDKNNNLILIQRVEGYSLKNIYTQDKVFESMSYVSVESLSVEIMDENKIIKYKISWKDNTNKIREITEYLIVINKNM